MFPTQTHLNTSTNVFDMEAESVKSAADQLSHDSEGHTASRTAYFILSLLCMLLMAGLAGSRFQLLFSRRDSLISLSILRLIPYLLYLTGIGFDLSAAASLSMLTMRSLNNCKTAMYVCLAFYVTLKTLVQLFLIERIHAARRYRFRRRRDDMLWLACILICTAAFGTISILAFISPLAELSPTDGTCRIGLPRKSTLVLMIYDILINIILTGIFLWLLRPLLDMRTPGRAETLIRSQPSCEPMAAAPPQLNNVLRKASPLQHGHTASNGTLRSHSTFNVPIATPTIELDAQLSIHDYHPLPRSAVANPNTAHLKLLIKKSLIGTMAMLTGTILNLSLLYNFNGEHGWLCYLCCMLDITWSVVVVHFLAGEPPEDRDPRRSSTVWWRNWER